MATVTGETGGIALTGVGDLVIGAGGLLADGPIVLDASGEIRVSMGGTIAHGPVSTTKPIRWSVTDVTDNVADPMPGSLRHVLTRANAIGNANAAGPDVVITFSSLPNPTRFVLQAQWPTIAAGIEIDRKVLADLAVREPEAFATIAAQVRQALDAAKSAA